MPKRYEYDEDFEVETDDLSDLEDVSDTGQTLSDSISGAASEYLGSKEARNKNLNPRSEAAKRMLEDTE